MIQVIPNVIINSYIRQILKTKIIKDGPMNSDLHIMPVYAKDQFSWIARKYDCGRKLLIEVEDIQPKVMAETIFQYDRLYEQMYQDGIEHMKTCTPCRNSPKPGDRCKDCNEEFGWHWNMRNGNSREEFSQCTDCYEKSIDITGKHVEELTKDI